MYKFLLRIVSVLIKIIYRVRVNGIENFKDDEPIIISANHIHIFDPVILATLTKKQIFFLAKKELFDKKFSAKFFSKLGVIPIDRENTDLKAIKSCFRVIRSGNMLGIFPEGNDLRTKQQIILPSFQDNFTTVKFSKTYTAKNGNGEDERITENNIKISKGEESSFIWSIFYTFLNEVILTKNDDQDSFPNLKYIFIDDPVSSLDDRKIIEMAVDLASLIKKSNFTKATETVPRSSGLKFIITTHHPLFFNVLFNELKSDSCSRFVLEHKLQLTTGDETYHLKETSDSPFAYHLKVIDIIDEAIKENQLEKYHYNLLRSLFEKTSTFLGYRSWEEIIPESEKDKVHRRYLNLFSHDKQSVEEFPDITEDDKEQFKVIYKSFIEKYYFNTDISHLN